MSIVAPITKALVAGGTEVVEALSSKLHQNTQEIFPSSIADDTASEMIDVVKTVNKNRGIQEDVTDKQIDYMERIHRREFKPHLLDRAIPNKDMKDEQLAQLIAEATEQKQLKNMSDEIDEDGEIFTEIKSLLRSKGKHSKILNNFKYIEEDLGIEIEDDMFLPFINAQLNRLDGFDMLTEEAQNYFRKSAYHLLKNHPLTKSFRQEYPQPDVTGVRQQIPKYIDDETEDWYSALEQQWSVDPDKALPEDMRLAAREDFLGSSTVLVPVYRSSSSGWYLGWDPRLNSPNEIGLHLGTAGQAWALIAKKQVQELKDEGTFVTRKIKSRKAWERENYYHGDSQIDDAPFDYQQTDMWGDPNILDDERLLLSGREYQTATIDEANTHAEGYARLRNPETPEKPHQIVKGYIRIRKPLIFPYKENGTWEALPILSYGDGMQNFHKNIARSLGHKNVSDSSPLPYNSEQMERLKELQARANKINEYKQLSYEKFGMPKAPEYSEHDIAVDVAKQMGLPPPPKPEKVPPKFKPELLPKTFKKQQKILDPSRDVDEDTIAYELAMWRAGLSEKDEAIMSRLDAGEAMAIDGVSPEGKFKDRLLVDMAEWQLNLDFQRWLSSFGFDGIKYINDVEPSFDVDTDHLYNFEEVKKQFKPFPEEEAYIETSIEGNDRHWSYIVFRPQQFKAENALKYDVEDARFGMNQGGRVMAATGWFNLLRPQKEPAMWLREIKRGDTLSKIAQEFGRSVEEIAELNRIKDINKIRAGDKIYIPRQKVQPQQEKITRVDRPVQSIRKPPTQRRTTQNILTNIEEQARKNIAAAKVNEQKQLKEMQRRQQQQQQKKRSNIIAINKPKGLPSEGIWQQAKDTVNELFNIEVQDLGSGITDRAKARQEIINQKRQSTRSPTQPKKADEGVTTRRQSISSSLLNPIVRAIPGLSTAEKVYARSFFDQGVWNESFLEKDELDFVKELAKNKINRGSIGFKRPVTYRDYNPEAGKKTGYHMDLPSRTDVSEVMKYTFGKADLVRDGNNIIQADEYDLPTPEGIPMETLGDKASYITNAFADYFTKDKSGNRKLSTAGLAHKVGEVFGPSEGTGPSMRINLGTPESLGISQKQFAKLPTLADYTKMNKHRIRERPISDFFAGIFG